MAKKKIKAGEKGEVVAFITERKACKKLQISIEQFRKLCILKGVYPRQPKTAKLKGTNKTYYLVKDIKFIGHDPLIQTFREIKVYNRRLKHYKAKKNKEQVMKLLLNEPTYTLDRVIKERYPTFEDAMRDMDDALTHIYLYSRFPSNTKYPSNLEIRRCARLCKEWENYVTLSHSVRKVFVSVKGYYYQVDINGHLITYVVPHRGSFVEQKNSIGLKTMGFFLELYQQLLGFVMYRLYTLQGLKYPPNLENGRLDELLDHLEAPESDLPQTEQQKKTESRIDSLNTEKLVAQEKALEKDSATASSNDVTMTTADENDEFEREVKKIEFNSQTDLFKGMKIFLSRETPTEQLEFLIKSFGGQVSIEGPFGTFPETDETITHQVVDRDTQRHMYLSRSYVQPQWIFDSVNEKLLLPVSEYGPTAALPPHLSPFVDDSVEGYVPQRREILDKIKEAVESGKPYDIELEHAKAMDKNLPQETVEEEENEDELDSDEEEAEEIQAENDEEEEEIEKDEDEEQRAREEQYERELQAELGNSAVEEKKAKKKSKVDPEEEKKRLAEMMLSKKEKGRYLFHVGRQKKKQRAADALVEKRKRNEEGTKQNPKKAKARE